MFIGKKKPLGSLMKAIRYKQSQGDNTLFIKHSVLGRVNALLIYVIGDDLEDRKALRKCLF